MTTKTEGGDGLALGFAGMMIGGEVLLQELRTENLALKSKLIHMDGCGHLVVVEPPVVPRRASHDAITQMVRDELKLYYSLRRRIKAHGGEA